MAANCARREDGREGRTRNTSCMPCRGHGKGTRGKRCQDSWHGKAPPRAGGPPPPYHHRPPHHQSTNRNLGGGGGSGGEAFRQRGVRVAEACGHMLPDGLAQAPPRWQFDGPLQQHALGRLRLTVTARASAVCLASSLLSLVSSLALLLPVGKRRERSLDHVLPGRLYRCT
jgi:hypothetical protein